MQTKISSIQNICVFCGGSDGVDEKYNQAARDTGRICAENGWRVVYGGGRAGLMGLTADSALAAGGEVTGIIPRHLQQREIAHAGLTALEITGTMHERQLRMAELSEAFVILPGGLGTLAEFFEVVTWKQLGLHDKPIVLINSYEYWNSLIQTIDTIKAQKFLYQKNDSLFVTIDKPADLPTALKR